jgi:predicted outer membrane repeat protein
MKNHISWFLIFLTTAIFALPTLSVLGLNTALSPAAQPAPTGTPPDVFNPTPLQAADANNTRSRGVIRARAVTLNRAAVPDTQTAAASASQNQLRLNLFPDVNILADQLRTEANQAVPSGYVWVGNIPGDPYSQVVLSIGGGQMAGYVQTQNSLYDISSSGSLQVISEIDPTAFESSSPDAIAHPPLPPRPRAAAPDVRPLSVGQTAVVDMLVMYTPAARNQAGGDTSIQNEIQAAITAANQAYLNSRISIRMNLVKTALWSYTEAPYNSANPGSAITADLNAGTDNVGIQSLRDIYHADLVTLVTYNASDVSLCGLAWQMGPTDVNSPYFPDYAYHAVRLDCMVSNLTLAHEAGHNMGANHDFANSGNPPSNTYGAYPFALGYIDPAGKFRTVMSYAGGCNSLLPCPRISYFSSSTVTLNGRPLGNASADNAQALNNTAAYVASFRVGSTTPVDLTPTPVPAPFWVTPTPNPTAQPGCNFNVGSGDTTGFINAMNSANNNGSGEDVICLASNSVYNFTTGLSNTLLTDGVTLPTISTPITILGNNATLQWGGAGNARFFIIDGNNPQARLTLDSVNLLNGHGSSYAGAIYNFYGTLNLNNTTFSNNTAGNVGGAIYSSGPMSITDSKFYGNSAVYGGAIYAASSGSIPAPVTITRSILQENDATYGSAIYAFGSTTAITTTGSCLINNTNFSLYNNGAPPLNMATNWWNSSSGPTLYTGTVQGTGDRLGPSGITYTPFLTGAPPFCLSSPPAPPNAPDTPGPQNGGVASSLRPTLTWNAPAGASAYEILFGGSNPPTQRTTVLTNSFTPSVPLTPGLTYYWQVRALGPGGASAWSPVFSFIAPSPIDVTPAINYYTTGQPTLTWSALTWATGYQVQVATNTAFTTLEYTEIVGGNQITIPANKSLPEGTHYWRVRGCASPTVCAGTWSAPQVIAVDLP